MQEKANLNQQKKQWANQWNSCFRAICTRQCVLTNDSKKTNESKSRKVPVLKNQTYVLKEGESTPRAAPMNARERRRQRRANERELQDSAYTYT